MSLFLKLQKRRRKKKKLQAAEPWLFVCQRDCMGRLGMQRFAEADPHGFRQVRFCIIRSCSEGDNTCL